MPSGKPETSSKSPLLLKSSLSPPPLCVLFPAHHSVRIVGLGYPPRSIFPIHCAQLSGRGASPGSRPPGPEVFLKTLNLCSRPAFSASRWWNRPFASNNFWFPQRAGILMLQGDQFMPA